MSYTLKLFDKSMKESGDGWHGMQHCRQVMNGNIQDRDKQLGRCMSKLFRRDTKR